MTAQLDNPKIVEVLVSRKTTGTATVVVKVPERVDGSYDSAEERAKSFVQAALLAGQPLHWSTQVDPLTIAVHSYDIKARRIDGATEPEAAAYPPPPAPVSKE